MDLHAAEAQDTGYGVPPEILAMQNMIARTVAGSAGPPGAAGYGYDVSATRTSSRGLGGAVARTPPGGGSPQGVPGFGRPPRRNSNPRVRVSTVDGGDSTIETVSAPMSNAGPPRAHNRGPPRGSAAASHVQNEAYMDDFNEGLRSLGVSDTGDRRQGRTDFDASGQPLGASASRKRLGGGGGGGGGAALGGLSTERDLQHLGAAGGGYRTGPADPQGALFDASDRPLMCMSVGDTGEAVVGGSDHALYGFSTTTGKKTRQLYSKRNGHAEWVTAVCHAASGEVVSGGMDGKLCVWAKGASTCANLVSGALSLPRRQCRGAVGCRRGVAAVALPCPPPTPPLAPSHHPFSRPTGTRARPSPSSRRTCRHRWWPARGTTARCGCGT